MFGRKKKKEKKDKGSKSSKDKKDKKKNVEVLPVIAEDTIVEPQNDERVIVHLPVICKTEAICDYNPEQFEQMEEDITFLTFKNGAIIDVVEQDPSGWWEGITDGEWGIFPGSYVEIIEIYEAIEEGYEEGRDPEEINEESPEIQDEVEEELLIEDPQELEEEEEEEEVQFPVEEEQIEGEEMEEEIEDINESINSEKKENDEDALLSDIALKDLEITETQEELISLKKQLNESQANEQQLSEDLKKSQQKLEHSQDELKRVKANHEKEAAERMVLEENKLSLTSELTTVRSRSDSISDHLSRSEKEVNLLREQIRNSLDKNDAAQLQLLQQQVEELEENTKNHFVVIEEKDAHIHALTTENNSLAFQLQQMETTSKETAEQQDSNAKRLQDEVQTLSKQVVSLKEQVRLLSEKEIEQSAIIRRLKSEATGPRGRPRGRGGPPRGGLNRGGPNRGRGGPRAQPVRNQGPPVAIRPVNEVEPKNGIVEQQTGNSAPAQENTGGVSPGAIRGSSQRGRGGRGAPRVNRTPLAAPRGAFQKPLGPSRAPIKRKLIRSQIPATPPPQRVPTE